MEKKRRETDGRLGEWLVSNGGLKFLSDDHGHGRFQLWDKFLRRGGKGSNLFFYYFLLAFLLRIVSFMRRPVLPG